MHERDSGPNKSKSIGKAEVIGASIIVGGFSGIGYGITRLVSDSELAEKVGIGTGGATAGLLIAALLAKESERKAEKYAIQGKIKEAVIETIRASAKGAVGLGISGAVPSYEGAGLEGAVIGGTIGASLGVGAFVHSLQYIREIGKAYRDIVHPAIDPKTFPQFDILKDELFDEEDILLENPPVYMAGSIADMQGFRQAQVDLVVEKSKSIKRNLVHETRNHDVILNRMSSAIFIISDVSHFPVYNPQDKSTLQIRDSEDNLITQQLKSPPYIWDYDTAFAGEFMSFNEKRWQYWRENSWKYDVALLAVRKIKEKDDGDDGISIEAADQYYIIDIITDVPVSGPAEKYKEKLKVLEKARRLKPAWQPGA